MAIHTLVNYWCDFCGAQFTGVDSVVPTCPGSPGHPAHDNTAPATFPLSTAPGY